MPSSSDKELLEQFAAARSNRAFAELVERHLGMVYAVALRRTGGDSVLAQEICQQVFIDLARKAGQLLDHPSLVAWLHRSTCFATATVIRREARENAKRSAIALLMDPSSPPAIPESEEILTHLDAAVGELSESDRAAILLRFFENRSFGDIGAELGVSGEAARKRVDRAVERLRSILSSRCVHVSITSLVSVLLSSMAIPPPAALAATVCQACAFSATTPITTITAIAMTKTKIGILATALAAAVSLNIAQFAINRDLRSKVASPALDLEGELAEPLPQPAALPVVGSEPSDSRPQDQGELLRLRGKVSQLRNQLNNLSITKSAAENDANLWKRIGGRAFSVEARPGAPFVPNRYYPRDQWTPVGLDAPEATLQTAFAAMKTGDTDLLASAIHWKSSLTEAQKQEAIARLQSNDTGAYPGARAVGIKIESFGGTLESPTIHYVVIVDQGTDLPPKRTHFQLIRVDDGWRLGNIQVEHPGETEQLLP